VFIVGLEEGLCPHSRSMQEPSQMEEERRLFFVGITRAMLALYLTYAFRRTLYGNAMANTPSRFLADIPEELLQVARPASYGLAALPSPRPSVPEKTLPRPVVLADTAPLSPRVVPAAAAASAAATEPRFRAGDRVHHAHFGDGIVVSSELRRGDEEVAVAFEGQGVKRLSLAYANLEPR
jgi:DNA helicase-2/ATP-dependent DNA helicase PcrA